MATQLLRFHHRLIMVACVVMLTGPLRAQGSGPSQSGGDITAALTGQAETSPPAKSEQHELKTVDVSATVTVLRSGEPYPAGGSVFAQIELTNTAKAKRIAAELFLESDQAVIRDVSGDSVTVSEDGAARIAKVEKIAKGKPRIVIVELGLGERDAGAGQGEPHSKLKVTLRQQGLSGETATLSWNVANCASGFYSQIVKVREGSGSGIADAIKAARSKDTTRPGRWLFPPRLRGVKSSRKCVRSAKRWNKNRGRYVYRCTRYETIAPATTGAITPVKAERSIFNFASRYVSARAYDRELSQTRDSGWATNRVSKNLQDFLHQKRNPAICTGAIPYLDYFDERMAGFVKRAEKFEEMAGKSRSLAQLRSSEALTDAKTEPAGHPGWGSAPLDLPQAMNEAALKSRVEALAQHTQDAELEQRVKNAENTFAALREMSGFFKSEAAKALSAPIRTVMYRALSAIEAADYIGAVNRHYADLRHALIGSMSTIRQAHANNCTCGP